ncbi:MAG: transcriptional repressor NrdR, partial [Firmicutes bacterium]|nr:transcriptional repressor NrdR [Bacillota bacterium]
PKRFTTYERVEEIPIIVRKRSGAREVFDRNKLLDGLIRAAEKRQISLQALQGLVEEVERELRNLGREVSTEEIAELLLVRLRRLDEVAYVRYASVFHKYQTIEDFKKELEKMIVLRDQEREGESKDQE